MGERTTSGRTQVRRESDLEFVVTRIFDAPRRLVFEAWTRPELFRLWWAPKSSPVPILSCEMDVRIGGGYRIAFGRDEASSMAFFGKYIEVSPPSRLVWTNDEGEGEGAVTTVTFEEEGADRTRLVLRETYASKEALDGSFVGMEDALPEQFEQLDEVLATLSARG